MSNDKQNGKVTRIEAELMVDQIREILPAQLQLAPLHAQQIRAKYNALVKEGFTKEEALEIVKSRPIFE